MRQLPVILTTACLVGVVVFTMARHEDIENAGRRVAAGIYEGNPDQGAHGPIIQQPPNPSDVHYMEDPFKNFPSVSPYACPNISLKLRDNTEICTYVCINDPAFNDIAGEIYTNNAWEPAYTSNVMAALKLYPGATFLDIGSNLGTFSLMAAAMGRAVVAVDAVYYNLAYLFASARLTGKGQIRLVYNSVNDEAGIELYPYLEQTHRDRNMAGATYLVTKEDLDSGKKDWNMVVAPKVISVTTEMLLADIQADTVIIKIDIEGYECKALGNLMKKGPKQFIPYIFMEWVNIARGRQTSDHNCDNLAEFTQSFLDQGYIPHNEALQPAAVEAINGFFDVVWIHKDALRIQV